MNTRFEFEAIGTHWAIDIAKKLSLDERASLLSIIEKRIAEFDAVYSRFRADSLVTQMSEIPGEYELPRDANLMITAYKKMYDATNGLVTPLIGKVLSDTGYDATYSLEEKEAVSPKSWEEVMKWDSPHLTMYSPALLDFGAGGKGYLVDIVSELIEAAAVTDYCVDAGGDMRQRGTTALRIGLENPQNTEEAVGVVNLENKSLCGSAGNRRKWGKFHHIINPQTLSSPSEILAIWVSSSTTLIADLCTTGLYFISPEELLKHFEFEFCIMYSDFSVKQSENFGAEIFL